MFYKIINVIPFKIQLTSIILSVLIKFFHVSSVVILLYLKTVIII